MFCNPFSRVRTWTSSVSSCEPWASHRRRHWARRRRLYKRVRLRSRTWRSFKKPFLTCPRSGRGQGLGRVESIFPSIYFSPTIPYISRSPSIHNISVCLVQLADLWTTTFGLDKSETTHPTISCQTKTETLIKRLCLKPITLFVKPLGSKAPGCCISCEGTNYMLKLRGVYCDNLPDEIDMIVYKFRHISDAFMHKTCMYKHLLK